MNPRVSDELAEARRRAQKWQQQHDGSKTLLVDIEHKSEDRRSMSVVVYMVAALVLATIGALLWGFHPWR